MSVSRRSAVKQLVVITTGVIVIPSCVYKRENTSIPLKHIKLNGSDEKLLAEVSETIIPATNTPGAKDAYAHLFIMRMVDDCTEENVQKQFEKGLNEFKHTTKKKFGHSFLECSASERTTILNTIENKENISEDLASFYSTTKRFTIQGYLTSKPIMTNIMKYELAPARYNGCAPVKHVKQA